MTQLSLDFASRLAERGMRQAQVRAEHDQPGFTSSAASTILRLLRERGPTAGETLVDLAIAAGHEPPDPRAFGPVFKLLLRRNLIWQAGWCTRRKGHATGGGRIWAAYKRPHEANE